MSVRFKYLRDPLFLACTALYLLNRLLLRPLWPEATFARSHLNASSEACALDVVDRHTAPIVLLPI